MQWLSGTPESHLNYVPCILNIENPPTENYRLQDDFANETGLSGLELLAWMRVLAPALLSYLHDSEFFRELNKL